MSWLMRMASLEDVAPAEEPERRAEHLACLVAAAEAFLAARGVVDPASYLELPAVERGALQVGARRAAADRAALLGLALQSPLGAACAYAEVDGGAARTRLLLERAAEAVSRAG